MEFTKEFIETNGLSVEQVTAITGHATSHIADLKGEWDGKANKDAEGILEGAVSYTQKKNDFSLERNKGEKAGDYLERFSDSFLASKSKALETSKLEYDEKIKNTNGNETLSKEFEALQLKHSDLQKKEASFDELNNSGIKEKYDTLVTETHSLKIGNAFNSVKPSFPDTVNAYEVNAKWDSFKNSILKDNTLEKVDNEWVAVDKENKHKITKLTDLVGKDADIAKLMEGRQQSGMNGKPVDFKTVEGIPFQVPANLSAPERSKLIKEYLASKGIDPLGNEHPKQFAELNRKILASAA